MLSRKTIDASDANFILMHALAGKATASLATLAYGVVKEGSDTLGKLAESFFILRLLRTDPPIYPENRFTSVMLRIAQFRLLAAAVEGDRLTECTHVLLQECSDEPEIERQRAYESVALSTVLVTMGIANYTDEWLELLRRYRNLIETNSHLQSLKVNVENDPRNKDTSFYSILFGIGAANISSVKRLEHIINGLAAVSADERLIWLKPVERRLADYSSFINGPWWSEQTRGEIDAKDAATRYQRKCVSPSFPQF